MNDSMTKFVGLEFENGRRFAEHTKSLTQKDRGDIMNRYYAVPSCGTPNRFCSQVETYMDLVKQHGKPVAIHD